MATTTLERTREREAARTRHAPYGRRPEGRLWGAGATAGVAAGVVMLAAFMVQAGVAGTGFFSPLRLIAATFFGPSALLGGFGVVLTGLIIHLAVSAGWGAIFGGFLTPRASAGATLFGGLIFGVVVWATMTLIALPLFNPTLAGRVSIISGWWLFFHLVYGGFLALAPRLAAPRY